MPSSVWLEEIDKNSHHISYAYQNDTQNANSKWNSQCFSKVFIVLCTWMKAFTCAQYMHTHVQSAITHSLI